MKIRMKSSLAPLAVLLGLLAAPGQLSAASFSWTGTTTTAWSSSNGWALTSGVSGSGYPEAADTAVIGDAVGDTTVSGVQAALNLDGLNTGNRDVIGLNGTLNIGTYTRNGANALSFRASGANTLSLSIDNITHTSGITYFGQNSGGQGLTSFTSMGTTALNGGLLGFHIINSGTAVLNSAVVNGGTLSVRQTSTSGTNTVSIASLAGTSGLITADAVAGSRAILEVSSGSMAGTLSMNNGGATVTELMKVGSGTLTVNSTVTSTVDQVTVKSGVLTYVTGGSADIFGASTAVVIDGGTIDLANRADGIGSFTLISGTLASTGGGGRFNSAGGYNLQSGVVNGLLGATGSVTKTTSGTVTVSGNNTYTGITSINGGVLAVTSLTNGGAASTLGNNSAAAANLVLDGGILSYVGAGVTSTDRLFTIGVNGGGLDSSGAGAVTFSNTGAAVLAGTNTARTFTLGGSNTGANTYAGILGDNGSGATSLTKSGVGTWIITADQTFTGLTTISGGTLQLGNGSTTGSVAGAIANNGSLVFNRSGAYNVGNTISGSGNVQLAGTGTASFTAANTFNGTVSALNNNVINVANLNAFQNATVTPGGAGRLTFDAGLAATGTVAFGGLISGNTINVGGTRALSIGGNNGNSQHTAGTLQALGGLIKVGTGTLTLAATGNFGSSAVTVSAGTLLITGASGAGTSAINLTGGALSVNVSSGAGAITNSVAFDSTASTYILQRATSSSFSAYTASSDLAGGIDTTATLLSGTASAARTLTTSFDTTSSAVNDGERVSDVFSLDGTGPDIFVMQLAITDVTDEMYLGWLNGSDTWVNAVSGNSATGGSAIVGYNGSFAASGASASAAYLGSWGYDEANNTVWAVLDHNSDFAVIAVPEPTTVALFGLGLGALFWRAGSRRRSDGK